MAASTTRTNKAGERHQHLICVPCNELLDVRPAGDQLGLPPVDQHGYRLLDVALLFRGACPAGQAQPSGL